MQIRRNFNHASKIAYLFGRIEIHLYTKQQILRQTHCVFFKQNVFFKLRKKIINYHPSVHCLHSSFWHPIDFPAQQFERLPMQLPNL